MPQEGRKRKEGGTTRRKRKNKRQKGKKRAPGAFILFSQSIRPEIKKNNPELKFTEIGSKIGEKWRALSEEEKSVWKAKSVEMQKKLDEEREEAKQQAAHYALYGNEEE
mmetsp:Transcript_22186/g.30975  ORF Transcript_22186/g.30975 Transcript_22186/m.30975 type:complete len:109 (+) Transcript_22186:153-479(+)|eukprot:CAMPEP_0184478352 /NCGR_PEP_ID=MMETSP0113_2-20130426/403_1 /TAXON_ID=91329 /ORGANISM="Norrisiella sphaerica, Strain BC52" /LENGTH=108 /DNA_ID=CAMNT_0026856113 /DNA_START=153 /DNA_END=479 /DNA_ORIENTATION=+